MSDFKVGDTVYIKDIPVESDCNGVTFLENMAKIVYDDKNDGIKREHKIEEIGHYGNYLVGGFYFPKEWLELKDEIKVGDWAIFTQGGSRTKTQIKSISGIVFTTANNFHCYRHSLEKTSAPSELASDEFKVGDWVIIRQADCPWRHLIGLKSQITSTYGQYGQFIVTTPHGLFHKNSLEKTSAPIESSKSPCKDCEQSKLEITELKKKLEEQENTFNRHVEGYYEIFKQKILQQKDKTIEDTVNKRKPTESKTKRTLTFNIPSYYLFVLGFINFICVASVAAVRDISFENNFTNFIKASEECSDPKEAEELKQYAISFLEERGATEGHSNLFFQKESIRNDLARWQQKQFKTNQPKNISMYPYHNHMFIWLSVSVIILVCGFILLFIID